MIGKVQTRICPLYEGSVSVSGYPIIPVLNTTSQTALPRYPKLSQCHSSPSLRTNLAWTLGKWETFIEKKVKKRITNVIQKKQIEMIVVRSIGQKEYQG